MQAWIKMDLYLCLKILNENNEKFKNNLNEFKYVCLKCHFLNTLL